ncbi:RlpA-like double-psi beta-barrel domain-containing protein [Actinomadura kijaniata]|uniref:RlpA-like double-psi beta-barrel domain-containing protein n=1 Tax=Actinomadura kijaniata TaxID=46161 RepID=UPI000AF00F06|nr:RlpA-like double-psi beta-barrel domain-containing protein [Actinomadura kijaniata]
MNTAREAADQLVRLTRLVVRADDPPEPPTDTAAGRRDTRVLRHNQAELTARERHVLGLIVRGWYTARLAELLELPERSVQEHLRRLLEEFDAPPPVAPASGPDRPGRRSTVTLLVAPITGSVLAGCAAAAFALQAPPPASRAPQAGAAWQNGAVRQAGAARHAPVADALSPLAAFGATPRGRSGAYSGLRLPDHPDNGLPRGVATATSFWDPATARGARMSYDTIASPYWPLGTRVRVSHGGRSVVGVVEDFGPADWAIAQHEVPAIIDLSEKMMAHLTGSRVHAVKVRFQVLGWGRGDVYRLSGPGHGLAFGRG